MSVFALMHFPPPSPSSFTFRSVKETCATRVSLQGTWRGDTRVSCHCQSVIMRASLRDHPRGATSSPLSHQLHPPPKHSTRSPSPSSRTGCRSTPGPATSKIQLSANCFSTGSWEDGTQVCTALVSSCLGRDGRVPGCYGPEQRPIQQLTQSWTTMSPSLRCPGCPDTALCLGRGGLEAVVFFLSTFFPQHAQYQVETFTLPIPSSLLYHQVLSTNSLD